MGCRMWRHKFPSFTCSFTCSDTVFWLFTLQPQIPPRGHTGLQDQPSALVAEQGQGQGSVSSLWGRDSPRPAGGEEGQDAGARPPGLCPQGEQRPLLPQAGALAERGPRLFQSPSLPAASVTHWLQVCVCLKH